MRVHKQTIQVFLKHRMLCVGCPIGRIHTVRDACREHDVPLDAFLGELRAAARQRARP